MHRRTQTLAHRRGSGAPLKEIQPHCSRFGWNCESLSEKNHSKHRILSTDEHKDRQLLIKALAALPLLSPATWLHCTETVKQCTQQETSARRGVFGCIKFQIKCWEPHIDTPLIHRRRVRNVKQRRELTPSDLRKWDSAVCRSFREAERIRSYTCTHSHLLYLSDIWVYSWLTAPTGLHPQLFPLPSSAYPLSLLPILTFFFHQWNLLFSSLRPSSEHVLSLLMESL